MSYVVCEHAQGSPGWFQDRIGKVTGSNVSAVFAKVKVGEAATRADYRMDLVLERITGKPAEPDFVKTKDMERGNEMEPHSRMAFEMATGLDVDESGFVYLPDLAVGCSVDGWITENGKRGIFESKSPKSKTHYGYLLAGTAPSQYMPQITHNMWVTGAEFCYFTSYDDRMPDGLKQFIIKVDRNEAAIREHEAGVLQFLREVDADEAKMRKLIAERSAA